jgi:phosphoribosyl-AMP cyclohydrolase
LRIARGQAIATGGEIAGDGVKFCAMTVIYADPTAISHDALEEGDRFAPRFDEKGLVTAITVEAATGVVLMVAHMNAAALTLTLETGEVHYFSRSRGKLWKKGETSGEVQKLREIRVDCDQDALLVMVEQTGRGAACHTGRKTCFYRRVTVVGGEARLADTGEPRLFDPKLVYGR